VLTQEEPHFRLLILAAVRLLQAVQFHGGRTLRRKAIPSEKMQPAYLRLIEPTAKVRTDLFKEARVR
jgi:hypothetical protein